MSKVKIELEVTAEVSELINIAKKTLAEPDSSLIQKDLQLFMQAVMDLFVESVNVDMGGGRRKCVTL